GWTQSSNFPTTWGSFGGSYDAFVAKFGPTGDLDYSIDLGGSNNDQAADIAVDSQGAAYVVGTTSSSSDFPTVNPIQTSHPGSNDLFVTKIEPTGTSLDYSTFLGGTGSETAGGIAVDSSGAAYVTALTSSTNFPTKNQISGIYQGDGHVATLTKIDPTGTTL